MTIACSSEEEDGHVSKCIVGRPCPSEVFEGMDNDACNRCQPAQPTPQHNAYQLILHQHAPNGSSRMPCKTVEEITNVMRFQTCHLRQWEGGGKDPKSCLKLQNYFSPESQSMQSWQQSKSNNWFEQKFNCTIFAAVSEWELTLEDVFGVWLSHCVNTPLPACHTTSTLTSNGPAERVGHPKLERPSKN